MGGGFGSTGREGTEQGAEPSEGQAGGGRHKRAGGVGVGVGVPSQPLFPDRTGQAFPT